MALSLSLSPPVIVPTHPRRPTFPRHVIAASCRLWTSPPTRLRGLLPPLDVSPGRLRYASAPFRPSPFAPRPETSVVAPSPPSDPIRFFFFVSLAGRATSCGCSFASFSAPRFCSSLLAPRGPVSLPRPLPLARSLTTLAPPPRPRAPLPRPLRSRACVSSPTLRLDCTGRSRARANPRRATGSDKKRAGGGEWRRRRNQGGG